MRGDRCSAIGTGNGHCTNRLRKTRSTSSGAGSLVRMRVPGQLTGVGGCVGAEGEAEGGIVRSWGWGCRSVGDEGMLGCSKAMGHPDRRVVGNLIDFEGSLGSLEVREDTVAELCPRVSGQGGS